MSSKSNPGPVYDFLKTKNGAPLKYRSPNLCEKVVKSSLVINKVPC